MPILLGLTLALIQESPDPYNLPIGRDGSVKVESGYTNTKTGQQVTASDIAKAAKGIRYVFVGESHATPAHHQAQARIIRALSAEGRHVVVGFEMFTRDNQYKLGLFTVGKVSLDDFPAYIDWGTQWGHDYTAYGPVFEAVRDLELPMVALNVPREWIRRIGREGPASIQPAEKQWLPDLNLSNQNHRQVFTALMGGHPMTGSQGENIYAAQVAWDTGMAQSAFDAMQSRISDDWVMVILAGVGHTMYEQGINYRLEKLTGKESLSVTCIPVDGPVSVSKGLGDYIFRPSSE